MNLKDIEIGKHYSHKIWEDDDPIYFKCIDKEDGYFVMDTGSVDPEDYPWLICDCDQEDTSLTEIHEFQYLIRIAGLLIEETIIKSVDEASKNMR